MAADASPGKEKINIYMGFYNYIWARSAPALAFGLVVDCYVFVFHLGAGSKTFFLPAVTIQFLLPSNKIKSATVRLEWRLDFKSLVKNLNSHIFLPFFSKNVSTHFIFRKAAHCRNLFNLSYVKGSSGLRSCSFCEEKRGQPYANIFPARWK